jgi:hypothetical protein
MSSSGRGIVRAAQIRFTARQPGYGVVCYVRLVLFGGGRLGAVVIPRSGLEVICVACWSGRGFVGFASQQCWSGGAFQCLSANIRGLDECVGRHRDVCLRDHGDPARYADGTRAVVSRCPPSSSTCPLLAIQCASVEQSCSCRTNHLPS